MRFTAIAVIALASTALIAQQAPKAPPGSHDPAAVVAGTYTVDPRHTLIEWTVDHLGFTPYFGLFGDTTGTLTLDPAKPNAAKVEVSIPVSKVLTANPDLTAHLLRAPKEGAKADFFGPSPADAHFVSTKVTASGENAKIDGNLTLNGVTKPVTLDVKFHGAGKMMGKDNVGFTAMTTIRRSDFGVGYGVPMVSDAVTLKISAAFVK
ncbi:YceI family protein [uncultured Sphingomonas sp.]|uniref:YceI family protein n=1 Tax=uncultured Sphingomonas sp. TaxID=158754 RepID=UPI002614D425|nr:YceI family protein [uncultured Sphingomonas sp.]